MGESSEDKVSIANEVMGFYRDLYTTEIKERPFLEG